MFSIMVSLVFDVTLIMFSIMVSLVFDVTLIMFSIMVSLVCHTDNVQYHGQFGMSH